MIGARYFLAFIMAVGLFFLIWMNYMGPMERIAALLNPTITISLINYSIPTEKPAQDQPSLIETPQSENISFSGGLPIGIITSRPALLSRLFEYTSKLAESIDPTNVFVLEDGISEETSQIIAKYKVTRVICPDQVRGLIGLNQNYRCLMEYLYKYTTAEAYVFVEEDLMLAPDFYSFFSQLAPVMLQDPSIFCISTWFDNGYEMYARNTSTIVRQEHFGGYGWAISRKVYELEIRPVKWKDSNVRMWDQYMQDSIHDRVCLAPEVPRTHHASGNTGATINQISQSSNFDNIRLSEEKHVKFPTEQLTLNEYDNMIADSIRDGIFVKCKGELLDYQGKVLLIYFSASSARDTSWDAAVSWFGMWGRGNGLAQRGVSRGVISFQYALNRVFLIGSYSPIIRIIFEKFEGVEPVWMESAEKGGNFGFHSCRNLPLFEPNDMKIEAQEVNMGRSCAEVCEEKGQTCNLYYLPYLNYCDKLMEITNCTSCVDLPPGKPSLAIPFVEGQTCAFSRNEKWLNCRGVPKDNQYRVCPCV